MRRRERMFMLPGLVLLTLCLTVGPASAGTYCEMTVDLKWSPHYRTLTGAGNIRCDDGQTAAVNTCIRVEDPTFEGTRAVKLQGSFTRVDQIAELFGTYETGRTERLAGTGSSTMTNGDVSVAISATDPSSAVGLATGNLAISRRK